MLARQSTVAPPRLDVQQERLLHGISRVTGLDVRILDAAGRVVLAAPREPERPGHGADRLARGLARCLGAEAERRERLDRLSNTRARLERDLALARLFAWDDAAAPVPDIVSGALTATVATAMGSGWTVVALAGHGFTYAEPADEDASSDPPPGWASWDELALEVHGRCPGTDGTWFTADLEGSAPPDAGAGAIDALRADGLPVTVDGRVAGFVAWLRPGAGPAGTRCANLEPAGRRLLERLARHASQRLAALQLRSEMFGFLFTTLKSLVAAVDAKDHYTRGHSERVHYLAVRAGEVLDLDPQALRDLSYAALLHDVGKIGIPRAILTKSSSLTPEEWNEVRRHPERGCRVVEPIPQLAGTIPAIRHHHEHFDGSGYPDGLAGEAIPLLARILAVADAFDAITSQRTYSHRQSCEQAVAILRQQAQRLFDPRAVAAVAQVVSQELSAGTLSFEAQRATLKDPGAHGAPG
jgi:HD-GYP domain-containing protein (c-di-GMP phosphodiesterase class II)